MLKRPVGILFGALRRHHISVARNRFDPKAEPFYVIPGRSPKWVSADEAILSTVRSGDSVFVQSMVSTPTVLVEALCRQVKDFLSLSLTANC